MSLKKEEMMRKNTIRLLITLSILLSLLFGLSSGIMAAPKQAYGWNAYNNGSGVEEGFVNIDVPGGTLTLINADSFHFMAGGDFVDNQLYMVSYSPGALYQVDHTDGSYVKIGDTGVGNITGFTYDVTTKTAYVTSDTNLYTIDLNTGAATLVGPTNVLMIGIACNAQGDLYGISITDSYLHLIDKTTGSSTAVGNLGINILYAQDICFDRDENILYGTLWDNTAFKGGFYSVDLDTGAASLINEFAAEVDALAIPYHPVTIYNFYNWDNSVFYTIDIPIYGGLDSFPDGPEREGYTFTGWELVGEDEGVMNYKAVYEIKSYSVKFFDWDGTVLKTETVSYGSGATPPEVPVREGYVFIGWDVEFSSVKGDINITPQYEKENLSSATVLPQTGGLNLGFLIGAFAVPAGFGLIGISKKYR